MDDAQHGGWLLSRPKHDAVLFFGCCINDCNLQGGSSRSSGFGVQVTFLFCVGKGSKRRNCMENYTQGTGFQPAICTCWCGVDVRLGKVA